MQALTAAWTLLHHDYLQDSQMISTEALAIRPLVLLPCAHSSDTHVQTMSLIAQLLL